jgi:hypothetical protein
MDVFLLGQARLEEKARFCPRLGCRADMRLPCRQKLYVCGRTAVPAATRLHIVAKSCRSVYRGPEQPLSRPRLITALIVLSLTGLYASSLYGTYFTLDGKIDSCLDDGGRWVYEQEVCEGARE